MGGHVAVGALWLSLFLTQERVIIDRLDKDKSAYQEAVKACDQAADLLDSNPPGALQILNELHEKLEGPDRPGLKNFERILKFEIGAGEYTKAFSFLPFQLRARAKMKMAESSKAPEEKRKLLSEAVGDLKRSIERGVSSSRVPLEAATAELAKLPPPAPVVMTQPRAQIEEEWLRSWSSLKAELSPSGFRPEDGALAERSGAVLRRLASDASPKEAAQAIAWLSHEIEELRSRVPGMAREEAKRTVAWCNCLLAAAQGVEPLGPIAASLGKLRAGAVPLAEYRGSFRLKIGPTPYADSIRLLREGREVSLPRRATPLVLADLEIGDYTIEMTHPESGLRTYTLPAAALKVGRTYILTGRMKEGAFRLSDSP